MVKRRSLRAYQGDTFERILEIENQDGNVPENFDQWTFAAEVRDRPGGELLATFNTSIDDASQGRVKISIPASTTQDMPTETELWYDVEATQDDGQVTTVIRGEFYVDPEVTA